MSICIRKRHALGSQLLHIRRPVAPVDVYKRQNTNKLKYVGAALLEGESVTLIQAARLVL